jgi:hypothetical protein
MGYDTIPATGSASIDVSVGGASVDAPVSVPAGSELGSLASGAVAIGATGSVLLHAAKLMASMLSTSSRCLVLLFIL